MGELLLWGGDDSPTPGEPGSLPGEVSLGGVVLITFCLATADTQRITDTYCA